MNRLIPGLALVACWLLLLLYGSFLPFFLVMVVVTVIGAQEYARMAFPQKDRAFRVFFAVLALLPSLCLVYVPSLGITGGLFLSILLLSFYILYYYSQLQDPLLFFSRAFFGVTYVGFLAAHLLLLHLLPEGSSWILVLTAITAGSDSGAYYCGRALGKHKLCPLVSPKKTIEGAIGGLVSGVAVAVLVAMLLRLQVSLFFLIPAAVLLVGIGIVGDLTESIIKRATGTKDSGTLLGGHGGVLDRVDSLLFAGPVFYYLLVLYHNSSVVAP
ncbi:MAG: phosphatidate cytidylyltransferase [Proteobacteria bacterium]|nr:phosphatidate cytidylyltransferase [Pseudomonadota bacterium]MBU1650042.1 phosphatidate cytidylyltransferase [Pseudomonadota bacterium]